MFDCVCFGHCDVVSHDFVRNLNLYKFRTSCTFRRVLVPYRRSTACGEIVPDVNLVHELMSRRKRVCFFGT